jgi:hypothetical protein
MSASNSVRKCSDVRAVAQNPSGLTLFEIWHGCVGDFPHTRG